MFIVFGFFEAGCPSRSGDIDSLISAVEWKGFTLSAQRFASSLVEEVQPFCRAGGGEPPPARGAANFSRMLELLKSSNYDTDAKQLSQLLAQAMSVHPDRISLPEEAGTVDPATILKGDRLDIFNRLPEVIPRNDVTTSVLRPCHRVAP